MTSPRRAPFAICLAVLAVLVGTLTQSAPARAATPIALGVNIANAPDQLAPMQAYASLVGRNPAMVMWYQQWSEPLFWSTQLPNTQAMGAVPVITWDPILNGVGIPLTQIIDGDYDSYIKTSADAAAAWKLPIYIRFAHEMNLAGSGYGPGDDGDTPAEFIAAWRHVVTIFRQEGATNVQWVWSPNVDCAGLCPFTDLYPGDAWVDWVALDGYNYSSVDDVPWESFDQIFGSSYAELTSLTTKPIMIAETASTEQGGSKASWITQTFDELPQVYPQIHAVVWFDRVKETDWTVNSSPASLAAWQAVVDSPSYSGSGATLLDVAPVASNVDSASVSASPAAGTTTTSTPPTTTTSTPPTTTTSTPPTSSATPPSAAPPSAATTGDSAFPAYAPTSTATPPAVAMPVTVFPVPSLSAKANDQFRTRLLSALRKVVSQGSALVRATHLVGKDQELLFNAPSRGRLRLEFRYVPASHRGAKQGGKSKPILGMTLNVRAGGRIKVKVQRTVRLRSLLKQMHNLRVAVTVSFTAPGRRSATAAGDITLGG